MSIVELNIDICDFQNIEYHSLFEWFYIIPYTMKCKASKKKKKVHLYYTCQCKVRAISGIIWLNADGNGAIRMFAMLFMASVACHYMATLRCLYIVNLF